MSDTENAKGIEPISTEAATELVDSMSRTELVQFVQERHLRVHGLLAELNLWAETAQTARAERDALAVERDLLDAALSERIEKTQGLRAGFAESMRSVLAAVREALPDIVADELRDELRDEFEDELRPMLADELRDELREELVEECAEDVREAMNRIEWL